MTTTEIVDLEIKPGALADALISSRLFNQRALTTPASAYGGGFEAYLPDKHAYQGGCLRSDSCPPWHFSSAPHYTTEWNAAMLVRDLAKTWTFSRRRAFTKALQRRVTERGAPGLNNLLIHESELLFFVEPLDICQAALDAWEGN